MKRFGGVCLALAGLLTVLVLPSRAQEQDKTALAVSPAITELILEPGKPAETTVRVTNITNFALPIKAQAKNFALLEDISDADREVFDASAWFNIAEPDFILQAAQSRDVKISVTAPPAAEPGGHYATLYFQPLIPAGAISANTAFLAARVGTLAFLIVKGDITEKASLVGGIETDRFSQFGPKEFKLRLKNEGNVHLLPSGKVTVYDWRGHKKAVINLDPSMVLPRTEKELTLTWQETRLFGLYGATAEITYGTEHHQLRTAGIKFTVLPWMPLLVMLAAAVILVIIITRTHGHWRRALRVLLRGRS